MVDLRRVCWLRVVSHSPWRVHQVLALSALLWCSRGHKRCHSHNRRAVRHLALVQRQTWSSYGHHIHRDQSRWYRLPDRAEQDLAGDVLGVVDAVAGTVRVRPRSLRKHLHQRTTPRSETRRNYQPALLSRLQVCLDDSRYLLYVPSIQLTYLAHDAGFEFVLFTAIGLLPTYALQQGFGKQTSFNVVAILNAFVPFPPGQPQLTLSEAPV